MHTDMLKFVEFCNEAIQRGCLPLGGVLVIPTTNGFGYVQAFIDGTKASQFINNPLQQFLS